MPRFEVGDVIRRVVPSDYPHHYGVVGCEYVVLGLSLDTPIVIEGGNGANPYSFELVRKGEVPESAPPRTGLKGFLHEHAPLN